MADGTVSGMKYLLKNVEDFLKNIDQSFLHLTIENPAPQEALWL
jgi:hypothetical protein